jgi:hypothetical protein
MCSKFLLAVFSVTIVTMIEATCLDQATAAPAPGTTKGFSQLYHPCPRSLLSYQFLYQNGPKVRCASGPTGNMCHGNDECSNGQYCCQDQDGCNNCVGKKH